MRFPWFIVIATLIAPAITQAGGTLPPVVILFGAAGSTKAGMDSCNSKIRNIPFAQGDKIWPSIAKEIHANPEQDYVLAGHSSATVFAERIAGSVKKTNPKLLKNIKLILLDGFGDNKIQDFVETHCWYAQTSSKMESLNSSSMKRTPRSACNRANSHTHVYTTDRCSHQFCLHFSLVNKNVPAGLNGKNWQSSGYAGCEGNKDWITKSNPK